MRIPESVARRVYERLVSKAEQAAEKCNETKKQLPSGAEAR
jgi:hypothetical protein